MATALLLATFPVALNDTEEISLREISSDLRFLFGEFEVHDRIQLKFHELRYRSLKTFSVFADDRAGVRAAFSADVADITEAGLSADQKAMVRVASAQVLAAWVSASTRDLEEVRAAAENKVMRLPQLVSRAGLVALRQRFEKDHGRQNDATWPCAALIERRLEECEEGSFVAPPLSEVISVEAAGDEAVEIMEVGSALRVRKAPRAIAMPATTEQLRTRLRTLAISYIIASYRHQSRLWLRSATLPVFLNYVEYLLGDTGWISYGPRGSQRSINVEHRPLLRTQLEEVDGQTRTLRRLRFRDRAAPSYERPRVQGEILHHSHGVDYSIQREATWISRRGALTVRRPCRAC